METIKLIKKYNGLRPGAVMVVTTATAVKRVAEGVAEYLDRKPDEVIKEDKEVIETKEEKVVFETKEEKPKGKRTIKAPK